MYIFEEPPSKNIYILYKYDLSYTFAKAKNIRDSVS